MELRGRRHSDGQPLEYFNPPSLPDSQLWHSDGQPLEYFNMVVRAEAPGAGTVRGLVVRVSDVSLGTGQETVDCGTGAIAGRRSQRFFARPRDHGEEVQRHLTADRKFHRRAEGEDRVQRRTHCTGL